MPWYNRVKRWCQTNLTEIDAAACRVEEWAALWKRNRIEGIVVNAAGIVAYYPSEDPLQYRSPYLGDRDLFLEFTEAARAAGIAVVARMDCNRATEDVYRQHPEWFAVDRTGTPYRADGRYIGCVNGNYYKQFIPERLREIIRRYHPDGFTDNSWQGLPAACICYCDACRKKFQSDYGEELPENADWNDPVYRHWLQWSLDCRFENWQLFNTVTRKDDLNCLWLGMVHADPVNSHCPLADLHRLAQTTPYLFVDQQSRDNLNGFEQNLCNGLLLQELAEHPLSITESWAHYTRGAYAFRRTAVPPQELKLWEESGIAGGIQPWLHFVGAVQEDRRQLTLSEPLMQWHAENQDSLEPFRPAADVALVWSQKNIIFYGKDNPGLRCGLPWRGFTHAMTRARIPFVPVHAEDIPTDTTRFRTVILPDLAVMTDEEIDRLEAYIANGGNVLATGNTGMLDAYGWPRKDHRVDQLLGICRNALPEESKHDVRWDHADFHSYLRIEEADHPVFAGFANTAILPCGGWIMETESVDPGLKAIGTLVPAYPIYPPEFAYPRQEKSDIPLLLTGKTKAGGNLMILLADIDRRYGDNAHPDHGDLLAAMIRFVHGTEMPYSISGTGYIASVLRESSDRKFLHLLNLSGMNVPNGFAEECYPVHGLTVTIHHAPLQGEGVAIRSLRSGQTYPACAATDGFSFVVDHLDDYDVLEICSVKS